MTVRVAIAGVGNCASALLQGLQYYATSQPVNGRPVPDRKSTRLNSSHSDRSRMPSSA